MIGQKVRLVRVPPCPPEFAQEFAGGGWRRVEMIYNCRTDLLLRWIEACGGDALYERRRQHLRAHGIRRSPKVT